LQAEDGSFIDPLDRAALVAAWQRSHAEHEEADRKAAAAGDARVIRPRSIADLIARYRASPEWDEKKPETRRDYEKALRPIERDWGHLPVAGVRRQHVTKVRDRYAWRDEPDPLDATKAIRVRNARQANRVVTVLSILLSYAVDPLGWRDDNPALRPRRLRTDGDGYRPWTPAEFVQFWERSDAGWRFNALLALLTGQRGQDQIAMHWADYDGVNMHVVQEKGRGAVKLWIPCHPALKSALDERRAALKDQMPAPLTILARTDGTPWKLNQFQKAAGKAIRGAGLKEVVWHGLRGAAASWSAEGGASEKALQALLGHTTSQMAQKYSRGADQRRLAGQAVAAITLPIGNASGTPTAKRRGRKVPNVPGTPV
jgi:integrase